MRCPECGYPAISRSNETCWRRDQDEDCRREEEGYKMAAVMLMIEDEKASEK